MEKEDINLVDKNIKQFDFWSQNPCGTDGNLYKVMQQRYRIEPWLRKELRTIPTEYKKYLEIGCGQGVDSFYICSNLNKETKYIGTDYSPVSLKHAASFISEAKNYFNLEVIPEFHHEDASSLKFSNEEFDFVYSNGVLHHTPNPQKCINEIYRILKRGGQAKIFLYRKYSLKVGVAKVLRLIQTIADKLLSKDLIFYNILLKKGKSNFFGSMFLECFGVPWMEWYSRNELENMFKEFDSIKIEPYCYNLPRLSKKEVDGQNPFGYMFKIDLMK